MRMCCDKGEARVTASLGGGERKISKEVWLIIRSVREEKTGGEPEGARKLKSRLTQGPRVL